MIAGTHPDGLDRAAGRRDRQSSDPGVGGQLSEALAASRCATRNWAAG